MRISDWSSDVCSSDLFQRQRRDVAALAVARDVDDLALHPPHPARGRPLAQVPRIKAGVEMIGIGIGRADRRRVLARMLEGGGAARRDRATVSLKRPRLAARQPRPTQAMPETGAARKSLGEGKKGAVQG